MFKKSNSGSRFGRGGSGGRSDDRGRGAPKPEMHRATCADCGQSCEVPFKPSGSRPVFCRECFKGNQGGQGESRSSEGFGGRSSERERNFEEKQFFDAECATCGDECTVPFKPKAGRPIFCRNCMGKKDKPREERSFSRDEGKSFRDDRGFSLSREQYEALASKVDKILKIVQGSQTYTVKKEEVAPSVPVKASKTVNVAKPKTKKAKRKKA